MAIINKGILGPVSGTVGTVIGGSWKGISYIRSQSTSRRTNFSQAQLEAGPVCINHAFSATNDGFTFYQFPGICGGNDGL